MDRIIETQKIINQLNDVKTLLDVGCRDTILKNGLKHQIEYYGCDLYQNKYNNVTYVGDITKIKIDKKFDCVCALDILEHVDDPYTLIEKLFDLTNKYLIVSLPNIYDLKSKYKYVFKNTLGGKYKFNTTNQEDRHRWIMNYDEIINFLQFYAKKYNTSLTIYDIRYGDIKFNIVSLIGILLRFLFSKKSTTSAIIGVFSKK